MKQTQKLWRLVSVLTALGLIALLVSACGSSNASTGGGGSTSTPTVLSGIKQTGPGLTEATKPSGARVKGGTVTFAEAPGSPPNYIFPMYSSEFCGNNNIAQLNVMLYRPLYWFGNNYSPTVDLNDSIGQKPMYSNGGKTVTIHLKHYAWSDGEQVSARDLVFWMNVLKADPAKEWCNYVPGRWPADVSSYKALNNTTFQMTFNRAYNPTWLMYNELSQIYPIPLAWDRTSLSQQAPTAATKSLPDTTKTGAGAVYDFLNTQSQKISDWGSSPLWSVVDGPWKVQSTTTNGQVTFVPNKDYSGPTKASISKFVEVPFTSEAALVDQIKSQGTGSLNVAYIPAQDQPLTSSLEAQGYDVNLASTYTMFFFPLNLNNPTMGPVFRQLYFRQAFQHLVDQNGWIKEFLHNTAVPTYGPVPQAPPGKLVPADSNTNPFPFSVADAARLLKANGWKVVPGGSTTCVKAGTAKGDCGAGIKQGQPITFNLDYESDVEATQEEMEDLQSQAAKVGIKLELTTHAFDDVYSAAAKCTPNQADCRWTAENYGGGWLYGYYPSGEVLFGAESESNYHSAEMNKLVQATIVAPPSGEATAMKRFVTFTEKQLPVVFMPAAVGAWGAPTAGTLVDNKIGGFSANAFGSLTPEDWYMTK
jgi:peptide/nickel transport system substrate-binding protein